MQSTKNSESKKWTPKESERPSAKKSRPKTAGHRRKVIQRHDVEEVKVSNISNLGISAHNKYEEDLGKQESFVNQSDTGNQGSKSVANDPALVPEGEGESKSQNLMGDNILKYVSGVPKAKGRVDSRNTDFKREKSKSPSMT